MYYHIILQKRFFCYTDCFSHHLYVQGVTSIFFWKKGTYKCLEIPCEHFSLKNNEIKDYWTHVLKNYTSSGDMDEMVDHWLVSFENFHKKYIILPSISLNPLLIE